MRAEEDYSAFRDRADSLEGHQRLKFLALTPNATAWASLGGDFRLRYEWYRNDLWGEGTQDNNGFISSRALLHLDVRAGDHLRLFGQVQAASIAGREGGPRPPDREDGDIHQLFGAWSVSTQNGGTFALRLGRQEVQYGSGCFISVREGAGTRRTFEGLTGRWHHGVVTLDAFALRPVDQRPGAWDNEGLQDRSLSGVFWTYRSQTAAATRRFDAYLIDSRDAHSEFAGVQGKERRATIGGRVLVARGPTDFSIEAAAQSGRQGNVPVHAWFMSTQLGWSPAGMPWSPRFAIRAGAASGDANPADGELGTFNALYPNVGYYGEIAMLGPANLLDLHPTISLQLKEGVKLTVGAVSYWRHTTADGLYGPSLRSIRPAGTSTARHVGSQFDAKIAWDPNKHTSFELSYSQFRPGAFLQETGASKIVGYVNAQVSWRF